MIWFRRINLLSLCLCFGVVVLGAYVRLSDAGLGCPDWPGCYGHLTVPEAAHEIARAEQAYPQRPVEAHKAWKEMIHRYAASTLGLLIVILAFMSRSVASAPRRLPWALVALVIFQGILGMWTVTWQLKPFAVSAHLLGGMATFALLLWMWLSVRRAGVDPVPAPRREREHRSERQVWFDIQKTAEAAAAPRKPWGIRALGALALVLLAGQIFLGGWTSSNYAALACPDLPTCHGSWWPETDVEEAFTLWRGLGVNYEFGVLDNRARVTIHFFHRLGAMAVTAVLLLIGLYLLRHREPRPWRGVGILLLGTLALQLTLGITIVLLQLPLLLAAGHNAGAALLLAAVVVLNYYAWRGEQEV